MTQDHRHTGSRERVLAAAAAMLAEDVTATLSVRAVAARAEVSTGSLRFHFPTQRALQDAVLARSAQYAMSAWTREITLVLDRVLATSPVADLIDTAGLAHVISAAFIGLELYDGVPLVAAPPNPKVPWFSRKKSRFSGKNRLNRVRLTCC